MVEFIISALLIFVILAFSILLWADKHGLNVEALFERINKKVSPDNTVLLHTSPIFAKDSFTCVQSLLGDKAYREHMYLLNLHRNFWYGNIEDNCPYIRLTLKIDDSQRDIFEASLKEIVKRDCYYLYGLQDTDVLTEWSKSTDYNGMLQITLFYARNAKEQEMLRRRMEYKTRQIIKSCDKVIDDEFGEDLHYVSELFGKSHVEPQLGKKEQLKDYLNKEGIYAEKGEQVLYTKNIEEIKDAQGNRSDLAEIERLLNEGYSPAQIFAESFRYMRYEKMIKTAYINKRIKETPLIKKMHNEYHFGESGTGKSYTYIQLCEKYGEDQVYLCSDYENSGSAGFDYYLDNPAKVIVLDEFRGNMKYSALLSILDVYSRNQQHCRFRNTFSLWESVYICSVLPPEEVYSRMVGENDRRSDPFSQLLRRLDKIVYHYIENGEYKTYEKPASEYRSAYLMQCEAQKVPPLYPALYTGNMEDFNALTSYSPKPAAAPVPATAPTPPTPTPPTTPIPQSSPTSIEAKAGAPTPPETADETSVPTLSKTE